MYNSDKRSAVFTLSIAIILTVIVPFIAFAQAEIVVDSTTTEPVQQPPQAVVTVPTDTVVPTNEKTTETVQETATSTQQTAGAAALEGTLNPEAGASVQESIPVAAATTTDENASSTITIVEAAPDLAPDQIPVAAITDLTVVATDIKAEPAPALSNAELNALIEPDFVMQLSGKTIPTKRKLGDSESVTTTVDASKAALTVSGTCSDVYYVVLLYKNQTDYDSDPASYILNRAYPCTGRTYSYSMNDLPVSIQNGTYYLLIGEQGDKGSWRPVTELTEVSINRSN